MEKSITNVGFLMSKLSEFNALLEESKLKHKKLMTNLKEGMNIFKTYLHSISNSK